MLTLKVIQKDEDSSQRLSNHVTKKFLFQSMLFRRYDQLMK